MDPLREHERHITRRQLFGRAACGLGTAALATLLNGRADATPRQGLPHFAPRAKRVIYLFQNGAPTHVELFDYKPKLKELHGTPASEAAVSGRRFSTMTGNPRGKLLLAPVEPFRQHGRSGAWISRFLPYTASVVDDLCFMKSMHTDAVNHAPAISLLLSGAQLPGRPTAGAWLAYGLGTANEDLPAFVVMT